MKRSKTIIGLLLIATVFLGACNQGGQTGEWGGHNACGAAAGRPSAADQQKLVERARSFTATLSFTLDEVKPVAYTGQSGWSPDAVQPTTCRAAKLKVTEVDAPVKLSWAMSPSANCPIEVMLPALIYVSSVDGAIDETMPTDLFLYFNSTKDETPARVYARAEQPLASMKGKARPLGTGSNAPTAFGVELKVEGSVVSADLRFPIIASSAERYAVWRTECP